MFINLINLPNLPVHDAFIEIVVLLLAAAIVGVISLRLRQPLIIGFIAVGLLVGPSGLKWIQSTEQIRVFAEMGLALLLFVVGLKLDLGLIRKMGKVSLATGLGQMAFSTVVGFGLTLLLGMPPVMAIYVAVAVIFSSTILIVKLLSDKRETDSLHGRIALGFLIVEDIVVVLGMIVLAAFTGKATLPLGWQLLLFLGKGAGLFLAVWLVNTLIFPRLLPLVARSTELLVLFGITWALVLAGAGDLLGFSKEVGAFVAGVSLASTMYRDILGTKLASLRDFLLLFFFLELGSHLTIGSLGAHALIAIPLVLLVMFGKPFIVMAIMGRMGYTKRTGFMAGLTVAQVSEFSLILIAMGEEVGHVGSDAVTIVTLVLVATMAISSHLITHAQGIYERLAPYLNIFERRQASQEDADRQQIAQAEAGTVILIGLGNYGGADRRAPARTRARRARRRLRPGGGGALAGARPAGGVRRRLRPGFRPRAGAVLGAMGHQLAARPAGERGHRAGAASRRIPRADRPGRREPGRHAVGADGADGPALRAL